LAEEKVVESQAIPETDSQASAGQGTSGTRMPAMRPGNTPYGKDAMRMSNSSMPCLDTAGSKKSDEGETRPEFEKIALSRNDQIETSIIRAEASVINEQLVASRQKIDVQRALKVARAAYAKSLPEKVEELLKPSPILRLTVSIRLNSTKSLS